jgi:glycosyltransferase involved in cell wall biosynthesis
LKILNICFPQTLSENSGLLFYTVEEMWGSHAAIPRITLFAWGSAKTVYQSVPNRSKYQQSRQIRYDTRLSSDPQQKQPSVGLPVAMASPLSPILLIAYLYPPDNYSGAARPGRFGKYLQRKGVQTEVLAAGTSLKPVLQGNVHRVRGELEYVAQSDLSAFMERIAQKFFFPGDFGAIWCARAVSYGRRFMRGGTRPLLISTSPPIFAHITAWRLKKKFGASWIADFRDPFAGMPWRLYPRRVRWLDHFLEKLIFRNADAIIANTDTSAEMWRRRYPQMADRIHVIWNGFDPEERLEAEPLPQRDYAVLAHVGEIYGNRRPNVLLDSVERLLDSGRLNPSQLRIHLAGPLDQATLGASSVLQRLVGRGAAILTGRVPRVEANRIIATSEYLLLLDVFHNAAPVQVPAKIFDYVRIGRPILACTRHNSPVERILGGSGIRYVTISEDDPADEVDRKLLEFLSLPTDPLPMSETFRNMFDGSRQVEDLCRIVETVTAQTRLSGN